MQTEIRECRNLAKHLRKINRKLEYNLSLEKAAKIMWYNSFQELKDADKVIIIREPSPLQFVSGGEVLASFEPIGSMTFGPIKDPMGADTIAVSHSFFSKRVN